MIEILIKSKTGFGYKWVDKDLWRKANAARQNGTITNEQEELLYAGPWESKE